MTEFVQPSADIPAIDPRLRGRDRVLAQIEAWRKELVNLARSNRLLNFRDSRSSTLGIVAAVDEIDELTFVVARLYGWNQRGSDIAAALDRSVTYLLRMKRLERDGEYLGIPRR